MNTFDISCEVCMDLIPLVQDEAASLDSIALVEQHLAQCPVCRAAMGQPAVCEVEGKRILKRLKHKISWWLLLLLLIGIAAGLSLQPNESFIYNLAIMPFLGALVYLFGEQKWYTMPLVLLFCGFFWQLLSLNATHFAASFSESIFWALLLGLAYGLLSLLGTAAAALFHYAFYKEKKQI
ncbi:MAG: zf-HC2 domain-containing protein [Pygmaiobacter sp.]